MVTHQQASQLALVLKNQSVNARDIEMQVRSQSQEDSLEEGRATLPGESHGQRNLAGYSPLGRKESDRTEVT